jgi:signal transduction histidine kinase
VRRSAGRFPVAALLAIVVPAAIVVALGLVSLRQWQRSAELLLREQARETASMAAEKGAMVLAQTEDDLIARLEARLAANEPVGPAIEQVAAAHPLVRRFSLFDRGGAPVFPDRWRDEEDGRIATRASAEVPQAVWERGGRRALVIGDQVVLAAVLRTPRGLLLAAFSLDPDVLARDVIGRTLGGLEGATIAAVLDHRERPVWTRHPLDGAERVAVASFGDALPEWRLALYQAPGASPRDTTRRQIRIFSAAFGVLIAVIVAGLVMTYRLMRRETEIAQLKSDFVANVSHDLKTPLSVIRMFGETLEMDRVSGEAKRHEYYHVITREAERLSRLIDNVLDFSRIEGGRRAYDIVPTAVEPLVRETVEAFEYPLAQRAFAVTVDVAPDVGEVPLDADAVGQALANLIDNAMKYSEARRVVRLTAARGDGWLTLSVEDEGIGIPRAEQSRIFDKFYRVGRSETQGRRGSGVGLALVRHVAEAHGGAVTVESEPGRGSRFTLRFPVTRRP